VTTMHAAAARRSHPSVALAVLTLLASAGLAGCETSSSLFSGGGSLFGGSLFGGSSSTPAPETAAIPPPAPQPPLAKIAISPIIGAPDAVGKQIQQEFTSSVQSKRVNVVSGKEERADYTLRGYVVAAKDKSGTKISYIWDVTDPSGKRVNRITGEEVLSGGNAKDPWSALTPQVAQAIAGKAANSFVSWLPSHGGQAAVASPGQPSSVGAQPSVARAPETTRTASLPQPVAAAQPAPAAGGLGSGSVTAVVPRVTGAPGDGSTSLTAAIQRELAGKGVSVTDKSSPAAYRVEGTVSLGAAKDGKQPISIEWLVKDPKGKKLGTVSQKNEIPEGSLNGAWDQTAEQAASAAAQGIVKLLPGAKAGG
jgi:hypothetical protein